MDTDIAAVPVPIPAVVVPDVQAPVVVPEVTIANPPVAVPDAVAVPVQGIQFLEPLIEEVVEPPPRKRRRSELGE